MNIATVRKYALAEAFPERSKHPGPKCPRPFIFISYLDARHQEGCFGRLTVMARDSAEGLLWFEAAGAEVDA